MVLAGKVQRELVSLLNERSIAAVGLSGEDAALLHARRKVQIVDGRPIDLGQVGDVAGVNPAPVEDLVSHGRIPVISSIAIDEDAPGDVLNVNADAAAAAIAVAVGAQKLIMLTDVEGIYRDFADKSSLLNRMSRTQLEELMPALSSGMIPKAQAALSALEGGVEQVHVIDGCVPHSMLLEVFTDEGVGTMITEEG